MTNVAKEQSIKDGKAFLKERFIGVEEVFIANLKEKKGITHNSAMGDATEEAWIELLRKYLPARYEVAKAFAVDHLGKTTEQLDCLIYDAHFTPALFGKDNNLYVPAEAVYATLEIKQDIDAGDLKYAAGKVASLRALQRTSAPLENPRGVMGAKDLFPIIGGLAGMNAKWVGGLGKTFLENFNGLTGNEKLDVVLTTDNGVCDRFGTGRTPEIFTGPGSLMRGLFRLLRALRAQQTVPAIEWEKYEAVLD
jgi:hypothetical protein